MRVLVACEFSGVVREAFRKCGHSAISCDLIPAEDGSPYHVIGDAVKTAYRGEFDLMIAHPPCTFLCNSGVRWLYGGKGSIRDERRWKDMQDAAEFFKLLMQAPIPRIAIENPIMHRHARQIIGVGPDQIIHPYEFGHGETKATCLWLKHLPELKPTNVVEGRENRIHRMAPSPERSKERSRTYVGIAEAMAEQWGSLPPGCDHRRAAWTQQKIWECLDCGKELQAAGAQDRSVER